MTMLLFGVSVLLGLAQAANNKVKICHIPPGGSGNFHTMTVNEKALTVHKNHGDMVGGPCSLFCDQLCDDGNPCTVDDCVEGEDECLPDAEREQKNCDDAVECTVDICLIWQGCINEPTDALCPPSTPKCSSTLDCVECLEDSDCRYLCNVDEGVCISVPFDSPSVLTDWPTAVPTFGPTSDPTDIPTSVPTDWPTAVPTLGPTSDLTDSPTSAPTEWPTAVPTFGPTSDPTESPTSVPTDKPTTVPTFSPNNEPTESPTAVPTETPTNSPTSWPTS